MWRQNRIFLSKLHVNWTDFKFILMITRSGLERVTSISSGIVIPFRLSPGMSAKTSIFSGLLAEITLAK